MHHEACLNPTSNERLTLNEKGGGEGCRCVQMVHASVSEPLGFEDSLMKVFRTRIVWFSYITYYTVLVCDVYPIVAVEAIIAS